MVTMDKVVIPGMIAHAKQEAPIEACGYLAEKDGVIVKQYGLKNTDASREHFSLDPEEQFEAVRDMRQNGLKLAAVYHSHPTTAARPSQEDIKLAYDPGLSYVIISLAGEAASLSSFRIRDGQVTSERIRTITGEHGIPKAASRSRDDRAGNTIVPQKGTATSTFGSRPTNGPPRSPFPRPRLPAALRISGRF